MADEDDRPLPLQAAERFGDHLLVVRIQGAGRLVEDQDRGLGDQCPGDRDPLPLPAGQVVAVLVDRGLISLGQGAR